MFESPRAHQSKGAESRPAEARTSPASPSHFENVGRISYSEPSQSIFKSRQRAIWYSSKTAPDGITAHQPYMRTDIDDDISGRERDPVERIAAELDLPADNVGGL